MNLPLELLRRRDIAQWHQGFGSIPFAGNNALKVLRAAIRHVTRRGLFEKPNPAKDVPEYSRPARERFVTKAEIEKLIWAIETSEPLPRAFFTIMLTTGARPGEVRTMRWKDLDFGTGLWHKPSTKTGRPQFTPLPKQTIALIQALPRHSDTWVFPGMYNEPWATCTHQKHWEQIRQVAGLDDVWAYDLRRTCASHLAMANENLTIIQNVLNHTSLQHTSRYARLQVDTVRDALQSHTERLLASSEELRTLKPAPIPPVEPPSPPAEARSTETPSSTTRKQAVDDSQEWPG